MEYSRKISSVRFSLSLILTGHDFQDDEAMADKLVQADKYVGVNFSLSLSLSVSLSLLSFGIIHA